MTRKAIRRLVGVFFIVAALVVTQIPVDSTVAETKETSDFQLSGDTLVKYTGTAKTVSVPDSVKIIGEEAFADNSYITAVTFPKTLEEISYAAFSGCNNITKIDIPDSVTSIGTAAFCNCSLLASVNIGSGVKDLGTGIFVGCKKLPTVSFKNNTHFLCEDGVIYDDEKTVIYEVLKGRTSKDNSYSMPSTVTDIKPYAFYGCSKLNKINLSVNLKEIPAYAFSFCSGLESIKIPYSVTLIDVKAFENCINLKDVDVPVSVTYIHSSAFDGCSKLNMFAPENSYAWNWFKNFNTSEVYLIEQEEVESPTETKKETPKTETESGLPGTPESVELPIEGMIGETLIVGRKAVFFIDNSKQTVSLDENAVELNDKQSEYSSEIGQMESVLQTETNGKGLSLPKFTVIGDKIAGKAFYADSSLKEYTIDDSISSIGDFAFARSGLKEITIPDSVQSIGYGAFYHCDNLSVITVPDTVEKIEASAFENTRMIENWEKYGSSQFLVLGDGILVAYSGKESKITIPEGVKQIGAEAFKDHKGIVEVALPDSLEIIREGAFSGCGNLSIVSGGTNIKQIEDRAFSGCPLKTVRIVDSVESIGLGAFDMSDTNMDDAYKTICFHGSKLPAVSYVDTTGRLSNSDYRKNAFEGMKVALIDNANVEREGSVLTTGMPGFSGLVCVISEPNTEYFNGALNIVDCTLTSDEAKEFTVPKTVYIYDKGYNFNQVQLDSVLEKARNGEYEVNYDYFEESDVALEKVDFLGKNEDFILDIYFNNGTNEEIGEAYKRIYGEEVPYNLTTFTVNLFEEKTNIQINKFGKETLEIYVPLPGTIPTANLHVIGIDEDGQLEDFPFSVVNDNDQLCVCFEINHTGNYGLYSYGTNGLSGDDLDNSPDTGDRIHPKWFLAFGCGLIGIVLFLVKDKKKIVV